MTKEEKLVRTDALIVCVIMFINVRMSLESQRGKD